MKITLKKRVLLLFMLDSSSKINLIYFSNTHKAFYLLLLLSKAFLFQIIYYIKKKIKIENNQ